MAGQYRFKDQSGNVVAQISASSAGAIIFSGSAVDFSNASTITLGEVQLAGTASNAMLLDGFDSTAFVFTSSFNTISQSVSSQLTTLQTTSGSNIGRLNNLESKSASVDISISNINNVTASNIARLSNLESKSSSVDISISNINSFTASNGNTSLNSKTGSYATTGSNTFFGTQTYSGSVYIANDLIVQGSSSIQYISASSVSIGTNIVQLNTANPSVRFAGLTIIDSGSIGGSGSFLYDSVHDEFVFVHRGNGTNVTSSHFVLGPETYDSLGNETYLTCNRISKGTGKEHLVDSCISDTGTLVTISSVTSSFSGLVGIGITAPQTPLHIIRALGNDVINIGESGTNTRFTIGQEASYTGNYINSRNIDLKLQAYCAGGSGGNIHFQTGTDGTGCVTTKMFICSTGNVGIGTTTPQKLLEVRTGGTSTTPASIFAGGISQAIIGGETQIAFSSNISPTTGTPTSTELARAGMGFQYLSAAQPSEFSIGIQCTNVCNSNVKIWNNAARLTISSTGISTFACQICTPTVYSSSDSYFCGSTYGIMGLGAKVHEGTYYTMTGASTTITLPVTYSSASSIYLFGSLLGNDSMHYAHMMYYYRNDFAGFQSAVITQMSCYNVSTAGQRYTFSIVDPGGLGKSSCPIQINITCANGPNVGAGSYCTRFKIVVYNVY